MSEPVNLLVNGKAVIVPTSTTVAVAVMMSGEPCRRSIGGEPRAALCGMGICFECRVTIDGEQHCRSCQRICQSGMRVVTDA